MKENYEIRVFINSSSFSSFSFFLISSSLLNPALKDLLLSLLRLAYLSSAAHKSCLKLFFSYKESIKSKIYINILPFVCSLLWSLRFSERVDLNFKLLSLSLNSSIILYWCLTKASLDSSRDWWFWFNWNLFEIKSTTIVWSLFWYFSQSFSSNLVCLKELKILILLKV